jgi:uncharacterized small protein (DUF1192 family)
MAIAQVNVLTLNSNQLPSPNDSPGGTYMGGTIMPSSNIVVVNTALAVNAALAKRDKKIEALQKEIDGLKAQLSKLGKANRAHAKSAVASGTRLRKG